MAKDNIYGGQFIATDTTNLTALPIGAIMYWDTDKAPMGWIFANGAIITEEQYPKLFKITGDTLPNVPDTTNGSKAIIKYDHMTVGTADINDVEYLHQQLDGKTDKGGYEGTAQDLKDLIDNKSIPVVNDLTTGGATSALSAEAGKLLASQTINGLGLTRVLGANDVLEDIIDTGIYNCQGLTISQFQKLHSKKLMSFNGNGTLLVYGDKNNHLIQEYKNADLPNGSNSLYRMRGMTEDRTPVWSTWKEELDFNSIRYLNHLGINEIIYIQDAGTKTAGRGYLDAVTGRLYMAKVNNTDTTVTSNFVDASNISNSNLLSNLTKIELIEQVDNLKLYRIQGNIGIITGNIRIDFSKNFYDWVKIGSLYKAYGSIGIPKSISDKIYNARFSMVTTYIANTSNHSVIFHDMAGVHIITAIDPGTAGVWIGSLNYIVTLQS